MLFDGAIRFAEQARPKMTDKDIEGAHNLLIRAQRIVLELVSALDKAIGDELYKNLTGLYVFIYGRLIEANMQRNSALVDEAIRILRMLRGTWAEAIEKMQKGGEVRKKAAASVATEATNTIQLSVEG
jgi:flagellar protein FliS